MIPKIIHYCWFGGNPLPKSAKKCIASWKKFFPDYEIIEWNEKNFDVDTIPYTHFCLTHKLWAYLSDFVRLYVVEKYGGWYFDTDVEIIRYPKELMNEDAIFGWEPSNWVATGLGFAAKKNHKGLEIMKEPYTEFTYDQLFDSYTKTNKLTGCPRLNTGQLIKYGLIQNGISQHIQIKGDSIIILSSEYMCPFNDITGEIKKTRNTFSIHWYTKSANGKWAYYKTFISRPIHRFLNILKNDNR